MVKTKRRLRSYMTSLLIAVFSIIIFANEWEDLFLGFFAGLYGMGVEQAKTEFGELSRIVSASTLVLVGFFIFLIIRKMRRKITNPIEQMADGMKEVSRGNLDITVPTDGDFEFEQMQRTFNHMVKGLKSAREEKELQEQRNQQLYAGIAHDLKTPMTMIMGYAKTLQEKEGLTQEDKKRYLQTIVDQTEQANRLLESMLTYAKLENQAYFMKKEKSDLAECLRSCVAGYYPTMEEAGIQIELEIPETVVEYEFDELEMNRVFLNLLSNMVKHNPKGTRCLVKLTEETISEKVKRNCVVIADNGPKISEELRKNIFEAFAVGESSRNAKNGSGLGLAVCKKIVERHSGEIEYVENWQEDYKAFVIRLGHGSIFATENQ